MIKSYLLCGSCSVGATDLALSFWFLLSGSHRTVLRADSWLCIQGSLTPGGLEGLYGVLGIEPVVCKASAPTPQCSFGSGTQSGGCVTDLALRLSVIAGGQAELGGTR